VLNQVRRGAIGAEPRAQLSEALDRYVGVRDIAFVPYDRDALDAAVLQARLIGELAGGSAAREALANLAAGLTGRASRRRPVRSRRLLRRGT